MRSSPSSRSRAPHRPDPSAVRTYYDRSTARFLRFGHGASRFAIHRAVYGPGVSTRADAISYVNTIVARELERIRSRLDRVPAILDLGCGVGGTLFELAGGGPVRCAGITISPVQVATGRRIAEELGIDVTIEEADASSADFWRESARSFDLIYAIESAVHIADIALLLERVSHALNPRGVFILIDDMISPRHVSADDASLAEFVRGWHAPGVSAVDDVVARATDCGLRLALARTLTPYLELGRPRDRIASLVVALLRPFRPRGAWFANLLGGSALQRLLRSGRLGYYAIVFERSE